MTGRRSLVVFAAAAALLVVLDLLVYSQYRTEVRAVTGGLDDRLTALGSTTARWLATGGTAPTRCSPRWSTRTGSRMPTCSITA